MIFKKLLLPVSIGAILLGFASCENNEDETIDQSVVNEKDQISNDIYLKVQIHLTDGEKTRGLDGGFVNGTEKERHIQKLVLSYYDTEGNYIETKTFDEEAISNGELVTKHSLVIRPSRLLAWANIDGIEERVANLPFKDAVNLTTNSFCNKDGYFMMTSSSYMQNNLIEYGSAITEENEFVSIVGQTKALPVHIYLERLAAKVQINKDEDIKINLPAFNDRKITFRLKGIALNGTNKSAYMVKNIADYGFSTQLWQMDWNDASLYRSYWGTDPNYIEDGLNINAYNYRTYREIIKTSETTEYCLENTSGNPSFNIQNATHVLVVGQYKLEGIKRGSNLYLYNGHLMTAKEYKDIIRKRHPYYVKTADSYAKIADNTYVIRRNGEMGNNAANVKIQLKLDENEELYKLNAGKYSLITVAEANEELAEEFDATKYGQGKCYYAMPIEHLGKKDQIGEYGVVRNHLYQITISSIESFGEGIWDPGTEEEGNNPGDPEEDPNDKTPEDDDPGEDLPGGNNPGGNNPDDNPGDNPGGSNPDDGKNPGEPIIPEPGKNNKDYLVSLQIKVLKWNEIIQNVDL